MELHQHKGLYSHLQISVWPHNSVRAAVVYKRRLTTWHHGQEQPVDILLLFAHRLGKCMGGGGEEQSQQQQTDDHTYCCSVLTTHLLRSAALPDAVRAAGRGAVCWALHHFDGECFLVHAGATAVRRASEQAKDAKREWNDHEWRKKTNKCWLIQL